MCIYFYRAQGQLCNQASIGLFFAFSIKTHVKGVKKQV